MQDATDVLQTTRARIQIVRDVIITVCFQTRNGTLVYASSHLGKCRATSDFPKKNFVEIPIFTRAQSDKKKKNYRDSV